MAVKSYKKGTAIQLSTNFKSTEFDCHGKTCCSITLIDEKLVEYLQNIRNHFNKPVNVSSAYRCASHNKNVGGATGSRHTKGQAADIYINGIKPAEIAKYAESIGILGIGLYETDADGHFVHVDTRTTKSFWYGQKQEKRTTFGGTSIIEEEKPVVAKELYRVRKSWQDAKSQIGAYGILENAKKACDQAGKDYFVFDSTGTPIYPSIENKPVIDTSKVDTSAIDEKTMWDFFKSKGLNDYGIAGLMGNLYAESGLRPCNLQQTYEKLLGMTDAQYTAAVDAGIYTNFIKDSAGYGLAQWTYWSLKQDMLNYFKDKKKSIGDGQTQMEFLAYQLSSNYSSVWNTLKTATSILEASNAVLLKFERPADQSAAVQQKRADYGKVYYDKYAIPEVKIENNITLPSKGEAGKMKYSNNNKPLVCMQTQSTCYKSTSKMTVKGVLWHSTGANNPTLKRYVQPSDDAKDRDAWLELLGVNRYGNDWNHITRQAGLNAWIGKLEDGTITTVQTMPWDFKPWGCGSGSKGSCNNGWIQFEICEDGLTDKAYFDKVYKEACEITAYLCEMYNIDPNGTVEYNGVKVPTILCHYDSHKLGLGSNHGDIDHWFPKFGKSMQTVREDVAKLLPKKSTIEPVEKQEELYRVRKDWDDAKSQIGAYTDLENAKKACDKAGKDYEVYNVQGVAIYPERKNEVSKVGEFEIGDAVKLITGAKYTSGASIPAWVFKTKLYIRDIRDNGRRIVISTLKTGAITGVVLADYLVPYTTNTPVEPTFVPYLVRVTADVLNVRAGAGTNYKITTQVQKYDVYTIVDESGKWGKLKSGDGWIHLDYTKKV